MSSKISIYSIFNSISGEIGLFPQGTFVTFVRFAGCNLKCRYCFGIMDDAEYKHPRITLSEKPNKSITKVEVGDKLLTFNENRELVETEVISRFVRDVDVWYEIKIDKHLYFVTPEHPFFTVRGLVEARNLKAGDMIYHAKSTDKLSFKMSGRKNPMKTPSIAEKSTSNTDYKQLGLSVSDRIKEKQQEGSYRHPWSGLSSIKKIELRKNQSICHKCHSKIHKRGYNFWNRDRMDGKASSSADFIRNGFEVQSIKLVDRSDVVFSKYKPLKVYNFTCSPYDSYLVDYMWVHNCDTKKSWDKSTGQEMTVDEIIMQVEEIGCKNILITGGEPLEQRDGLALLADELLHRGYTTQVETNGSHFPDIYQKLTGISLVHHWVVDYKLSSSNVQSEMMSVSKFSRLPINCTLKFVCMNFEDYNEAIHIVDLIYAKNSTQGKIRCAFSVAGKLTHGQLVEWLQNDKRFDVIINTQIHKWIFPRGEKGDNS